MRLLAYACLVVMIEAAVAQTSAVNLDIDKRSKLWISASGVRAEKTGRAGENARFKIDQVMLSMPEPSQYSEIKYENIGVYVYKRTAQGNEFVGASQKRRVEGTLNRTNRSVTYGPLDLVADDIGRDCSGNCFIAIQILIWYGEYQSSGISGQANLVLP